MIWDDMVPCMGGALVWSYRVQSPPPNCLFSARVAAIFGRV